MKKFRRAIFCYLILWAYAPSVAHGMHAWIINLKPSRKKAGAISKMDALRDNISDWAFAKFFERPLEFNVIVHILGGDAFYEQNLKDIDKLHAETGKNIITLWDTDPIFNKYPHLRGFARNREFEKMWARTKVR